MDKQKRVFITKKTKNNKPVIVVSKKVLSKAVERNKIKRRIREIIKKCPPEKIKGVKLIITPRILKMSYQELKEKIEKEILSY